jgi:hypothetical protein
VEPSGRSRPQVSANREGPRNDKALQTAASSCRPLRRRAHGKEGVDGSSPSERSGKPCTAGLFPFRTSCSDSRMLGYGAFSGALRFHAELIAGMVRRGSTVRVRQRALGKSSPPLVECRRVNGVSCVAQPARKSRFVGPVGSVPRPPRAEVRFLPGALRTVPVLVPITPSRRR